MSDENKFSFVSDAPTHEDIFSREEYIKHLAQAIATTDVSNGLVVGIMGAWGTGKTSLKDMLIDKLEKNRESDDNESVIVDFNPWIYSGSNKLIALLFTEISKSVSSQRNTLNKVCIRSRKTERIL